MLGRLARWLRVLGYDTSYYNLPHDRQIDLFLEHGRILLSRRAGTVEAYSPSVIINEDRVGEQLRELREELELKPAFECLFTRCLLCNSPLLEAGRKDASDTVPDYVLYRNMGRIRRCPECNRFFWPGSHRERMLQQLADWGFSWPESGEKGGEKKREG